MAEFADLPIVPHGVLPGVECCGCIVAVVNDNNVELRCNECDAIVGTIQADILWLARSSRISAASMSSFQSPPFVSNEHHVLSLLRTVAGRSRPLWALAEPTVGLAVLASQRRTEQPPP